MSHTIFLFIFQQTSLTFAGGILPVSIVTVTVFILDYYVEAVAATKLEPASVARNGAMAIFSTALVFSFIWRHPFIETLLNLSREVIAEDHLLSGGVVFSFVLIFLGLLLL